MKAWSLRFLTLPWKIWTKQNFLNPWKFCKIVLHPLEIQRSNAKTYENATWFFLDHPWKFHFYSRKFWTNQIFTLGNSVKFCHTLWSPWKLHFFFSWLLEFQHYTSSTPQEIPCPQTHQCPLPLFGFLSISLFLSLSLSIYIIRCLIILKRGQFSMGNEPPLDESSEVKRS